MERMQITNGGFDFAKFGFVEPTTDLDFEGGRDGGSVVNAANITYDDEINAMFPKSSQNLLAILCHFAVPLRGCSSRNPAFVDARSGAARASTKGHAPARTY